MSDQSTYPHERRLKLNETKRREVCAILSVGGTRTMAATYVGCATATIRSTAQKLPDFAEQLRKAEVNPELTFLKTINAAGGDVKQWRAAAWALERMFPERYARRPADTVTLDQLTEVIKTLSEIIVGEVPVKQYRKRLLERLAKLIEKPPSRSRVSPRREPESRRDSLRDCN
jgi:hypothetical protein